MKPLHERNAGSKIAFTVTYLISLLGAVGNHWRFIIPITMLLVVWIGPKVTCLYDSYKEARGSDLERAIRRYHGGTGPR